MKPEHISERPIGSISSATASASPPRTKTRPSLTVIPATLFALNRKMNDTMRSITVPVGFGVTTGLVKIGTIDVTSAVIAALPARGSSMRRTITFIHDSINFIIPYFGLSASIKYANIIS